MEARGDGRGTAGMRVPPQFEPRSGIPQPPLHRLRAVRERQGLTLEVLAARMGVDRMQLQAEEHPESDVTLSVLSRWSHALQVPTSDLLIDHESDSFRSQLSPVRLRQLEELADQIAATSRDASVRALAEGLSRQLGDMAPE